MMVSPTATTRHGSAPARAVGIFLKVRESNNRPVQLRSFNCVFHEMQQAVAQQGWSHLLLGTGQGEIPEKSSGKRGLVSMIVMRRPLHFAPGQASLPVRLNTSFAARTSTTHFVGNFVTDEW
jgi:hypothetical protein